LELKEALQMSNDNKISVKGKTFNFNQMGAWIAFAGTLFMFWQFMRDVHKDNVEARERIVTIEQKLWPKS
jgi:hypothetical protein